MARSTVPSQPEIKSERTFNLPEYSSFPSLYVVWMSMYNLNKAKMSIRYIGNLNNSLGMAHEIKGHVKR
jgi:hypothetical protein